MENFVNQLYFGDNLDILREHILDESVDLIYLDPPFNSKANYNILFGESGFNGSAQIKAFGDTWHWGNEAARTYEELMKSSSKIADMIESLCNFLGKNDVTAYLVMMTIRLVELHRVLKSTGVLYLHCDPVASHYLKVVLDVIFGASAFRNEIIWQRDPAGKGGKRISRQWPRTHDVILYYSKSESRFYKQLYRALTDKQQTTYRLTEPESGRQFKSVQLGNYSQASIEDFKQKNLIYTSRFGKQYKKYYLDEANDTIGDIWVDILGYGTRTASRDLLGYPTQKPLALLERIIEASSQPEQLVLNPFCGCGTALLAAQKLKRHWIGIDVTHLAIGLIEQRLVAETKIHPKVFGAPQAFPDACNLFERDPWQFEAWAVSRLPRIFPKERNFKRGADHGVDGVGRLPLQDGSHAKILAQVKGGRNLNESMIRDFIGTLETERAQAGVFIVLSEKYVTVPMQTKAAQAGRFSAQLKGGLLPVEAPKIQIWSIEEYFKKILPDICISY